MVEPQQHSWKNDWLLFLSRLFLLIAVLVTVTLFPLLDTNLRLIYIALAVGAALCVLALILQALSLYPSAVALLIHLLDLVVLLVILHAYGSGYSPLFILAAVPVVVGSMHFGVVVGLISALVLAIGYGLELALAPGSALSPTAMISYGLTVCVLLMLAIVAPGIARASGAASIPAADLPREHRSSESRDRLKTIYQLASTLSATLSYERVLDALVDTSGEFMRELDGSASPSARLVFLYSDKHRLKVNAHRNLVDVDLDRAISDQDGLVGQAITTAEPVVSNSAANDPELKSFASLASAQSLLCVPLRAGFEVYGVALLSSSRPNAFNEDDVELITAFCNQAVIALQNTRLYQSLQEDKQRIIDTQEEARRRLARELHDGPTQAVSAIAMRLNFTKVLIRRDPVKASAELDKLEDLARRTAKEIRTMLFTLRPVALETQGLTAALKQYADKLQDADGLKVHIQGDMEERFSPAIEGVAFSVIEEAINNARKHAKAENIFVRLRLQQELFIAEVEDDGRGFDVASVDKSYDQRGSLGLINMRERAALVSGTLRIDSKPGAGTKVTLVFPTRDAALAAPT